MKLASITTCAVTGDSHVWRVVFSHETGNVEKRVRMGSCFCAVHGNDPVAIAQEVTHQFMLAAREAERDIASRMFGDDWKAHVALGPWQDYELRRLAAAVEMWPDFPRKA